MPKLTCNITGNQYYITDENLDKRSKTSNKTISEFLKVYICKKAEMLIRKGYNIKDIRSMLECSDTLPDLTEDIESEIINEYTQSSIRRVLASYESVSSLATNESEPIVDDYIKFLKK